MWPSRSSLTCAPEEASHSHLALSLLPEQTIFPSGLKATLFRDPLWPSRGSPTCAPEEASQSLTVLLVLPEATIFS